MKKSPKKKRKTSKKRRLDQKGAITDVKEWLPEFSVSAEEDRDLMKYFHKTDSLNQIFKDKKWMILGRKGSGKTAIFEYFEQEISSNDNTVVISLNFQKYPWPVHQLYKESLASELSSYEKSWRFLILTQAAAAIIAYEEKHKQLSQKAKDCKKLIKAFTGRPIPTLMDTIRNKLISIKKLSGPSIDPAALGGSLGEIEFEEAVKDPSMVARMRHNAFTLLQYFESFVAEEKTDLNIFVTMDQLDENWMSDQIPEYSRVLINLINAAKELNNNSSYSNMKILIFLRTDIFDTLKFNDKNKIYQSSTLEIRWDAETLNSMFFERIREFKPASLMLIAGDDSNVIFEQQTVRHGTPPFRYLFRRTFSRPRDIIVYFNKIRLLHNRSKTGRYLSKDLYAAEKDFSQSMYNELIDEWSNQRPEIEQLLSTLQNIGIQNFKTQDFIKNYRDVTGVSLNKAQTESHLLFLFNNSIIGQKISANWVFVCNNPHHQMNLKKPFQIHNALKSRLQLTEARAKQSQN